MTTVPLAASKTATARIPAPFSISRQHTRHPAAGARGPGRFGSTPREPTIFFETPLRSCRSQSASRRHCRIELAARGAGHRLEEGHLELSLRSILSFRDDRPSVAPLPHRPLKQRERVVEEILLRPESTELLELFDLAQRVLVDFELEPNGVHRLFPPPSLSRFP